ncbi:hypothetical protein BDZ94DRAFT_1253563 [Collybia nuda]|uniref:Uncharacterized protein n=1 Tax=Collybia nuda TaxID=64659 RepID=A0A9P5YBH5_9AGAR|nr:hypothetical protein BDZ94DRAFT_1253563 [Collybia nuda]
MIFQMGFVICLPIIVAIQSSMSLPFMGALFSKTVLYLTCPSLLISLLTSLLHVSYPF